MCGLIEVAPFLKALQLGITRKVLNVREEIVN